MAQTLQMQTESEKAVGGGDGEGKGGGLRERQKRRQKGRERRRDRRHSRDRSIYRTDTQRQNVTRDGWSMTQLDKCYKCCRANVEKWNKAINELASIWRFRPKSAINFISSL